jgi:prevent-host-death family protein
VEVTATEAKNRLGQMLEHAQREPVFIAKSGRPHSVLISAEQYERLVTQYGASLPALGPSVGKAFYQRHKEWVDRHNALVEAAGIPGEEFRPW